MPTDHDLENRFDDLFRDLYPGVCRFIARLTGDADLARDVAQESFLRLHRLGLDALGPEDARFWVIRVARNLALNELEKRRTRHRLLATVVDFFRRPRPDAEQTAAVSQTHRQLLKLVADLPEHQRAALLLRELEEMSYAEIALALGVPESKVKSDLFRARAAVRDRWHAEFETPPHRRARN